MILTVFIFLDFFITIKNVKVLNILVNPYFCFVFFFSLLRCLTKSQMISQEKLLTCLFLSRSPEVTWLKNTLFKNTPAIMPFDSCLMEITDTLFCILWYIFISTHFYPKQKYISF